MKASIIIPTFNARERLYYNLQSLDMLEYPREDFEVIVVDNNSTDGTSEMISSINTSYNMNSVFANKNKGRGFARNVGVKAAKGDLLIFLDSDMIVDKTFLAKHLEAHRYSNTAVCGQSWSRVYSFYYEDFKGYLKRNLNMQLLKKGNFEFENFIDKQALISEEDIKNNKCFDFSFNLAKLYEAEKDIIEKYGDQLEGYYFPWSFLVTSNCSVEKALFNKIGGFDNNFIGWGCEDLDLGYRLYINGCKFIKQNDIKSMHQEHPINFLDNGVENMFYFTKKYNSIDLLLFYYGYLIKVDKAMANDIMKEIHSIKLMKLNEFLDIYRRLIVALRNKNFKFDEIENNWVQEIKKIKYDMIFFKQELLSMLSNIEIGGTYPNFIYTFKLLVIKVFNKRLEHLY